MSLTAPAQDGRSRAAWHTGLMITAEQLKSAVDPVKVINIYVRLRKAGARHIGLCPFHAEKTPSFSLSANGLWHCFGCGKGGDVFTFVELIEELDFREAKRKLAELGNVPLDERDTYSQSPLALKLSGREARAFDRWLSVEMRRLSELWRWLDQQREASMAFLEGCWNEGVDQKPIQDAHRALTTIHEAQQLVDDRLGQLDRDSSAEIECFLRRLYGQEDFRAMVMPQ